MPAKTNIYLQMGQRGQALVVHCGGMGKRFPSILSVIDCPTKLGRIFCFQIIWLRNFVNSIFERLLQERSGTYLLF